MLKKIIISRADAIGDVVLTLPVCGLIKKHYPNIKIIFIGKGYTRSVVKCCEYVDEFVDADQLLKLGDELAVEQLKLLKADAIIHVYPIKRIAKLSKTAGIELRVGTINRLFHWPTVNKFLFLSRKNSKLHESQLNCKLLEGIGIREIPTLDEIYKYIGFTKFSPLNSNTQLLLDKNKKCVILHPKSSGSGREWPLENFKELISLLPSEKYQIFISGAGVVETQLLTDWIKTIPSSVVNICGKLSLDEFVAFIKQADFLVASGTGPLHIAGVCGIGAIGIFPPLKPIHPGRWQPIGKIAQAVCNPINCNKCRYTPDSCPCMSEITAKEIAKRIFDMN